MSWFSKGFHRVSKDERNGIEIGEVHWVINSGDVDVPLFIRGLKLLFPEGATLCLEGTSIAPEVQHFLQSNGSSKITKVRMGTIWPRPQVFHIPARKNVLKQLADLAERHATPEICDHLHVYKDGEVLLSGYDFPMDEVCLSSKVGENLIKQFCSEIKCAYQRRI